MTVEVVENHAIQEPGEARRRAVAWLLEVEARPDDAALRARLAAWRAASPAHDAAYATAERAWRLTAAVGPAVRAPAPDARAPTRTRGFLAAAVAGLAAALVIVGLAPGLWVMTRASAATGVGEDRTVSLADGGTAVLGGDSAIRIAYSGAERRVEVLKGEAFFTVGRDPAHRPFRVVAGGLTMTDVGTAFDVALRPGGATVAVANGRVAVFRSGREALASLGAGERLRVAGGGVERARVWPDGVAAWRSGREVVDDETVADAAATIGRYRQALIVIPDARLRARRVSGLYDLGAPEKALAAVVAPFGGRVTEVSPYLLIVSANPSLKNRP